MKKFVPTRKLTHWPKVFECGELVNRVTEKVFAGHELRLNCGVGQGFAAVLTADAFVSEQS